MSFLNPYRNDCKENMALIFGRSKIRERIFPAILFILLSIFLAQTLFGQKANKLSIWKSNETLVNQLDTATSVEGVLINPPKGYALQTELGPEGSKITAWIGAERSDGTRAQLVMLTVSLPAEEIKNYSLEQILDELVNPNAKQRKDWQRSPTEKGIINGLTFVRSRWSGLDIPRNRKMYGFSYVTIVGKKVIQLSSQDVDAYHKEALDLAESSALTIKTTMPSQTVRTRNKSAPAKRN